MTFAAQRGPVGWIRSGLAPRKLPGSNCRPRRPATNQSPRSAPASPALASHVTAASRSCPNPSQFPGGISQGIPLRRTNRIPVRQARSGKRGLPPWGLSVWAAAAVESDFTKPREAKECSWIEHPSTHGNSFPVPATGKEWFCRLFNPISGTEPQKES
jgi:hypothetical protein